MARNFRGTSGLTLAGVLVLATGAVAGATGVLADTAPNAGSQPAAKQLSYNCQFPSGAQQVNVTLTALMPRTVAAGQPIQPASVQTTATLPPAAASDLTKAGAATVTGTGQLTMTVAADGRSAAVAWPGQLPGSTAVPAQGNLVLTTAGAVPATTAPASGTVTFTAGTLSLLLDLKAADGSPASTPTLSVACTLSPGQGAVLDSVAVSTASPSPSPSPTKTAVKHRRPAPKGCGHIKVTGHGVPSCAYVTGFSDVRKFNEAALLRPAPPKRPGLLNVAFAEHTKIVKSHRGIELVAHSTAKLYYHGREELPPLRATFLAFRFVPVTATMQLTELTPIKIVSVSDDFPPYGIKVTSHTKVSLHISHVTVNGVPLNVGPHCQPIRPLKLTLIGRGKLLPRPHGYTVPTGGPLSGDVTIPAFKHCGVTENLDPLFTGSISGPGNFTIMTQGKLCMPTLGPASSVCPPPIPKPRR